MAIVPAATSKKDYQTQLEEELRKRSLNIPKKEVKESPLQKLSRVLNIGTATVAGAARGAIRPDISVLEGVKQGVQKNIGFKDVLKEDLGIKPKTLGGKIALGTAGLALDIALDPLTYISFGAGKGVQLATKEGTKVLSKTGQKELTGLIKSGINEDLAKRFIAKKSETIPDLIKQSGINYMGRHIPGTERISPAIQKIYAQKVASTPLGKWASEIGQSTRKLFDRDAGISGLKIGKDGTDPVKFMNEYRNKLTFQTTKNITQIDDFIKKFGLKDKDLSDIYWARVLREAQESQSKWLENPRVMEVLKGKKSIEQLSKKAQQFSKLADDYFDTILVRDKNADILKEGIANYTTTIWKDKAKAKSLSNTFVDRAIDQSSRFGKHKVFDDVLHGIALGLDPEDNLAKLMYARKQSSDIARMNQNFVENVMAKWADVVDVGKMSDSVSVPVKGLDDMVAINSITGLKQTKKTQSILEGLKKPILEKSPKEKIYVKDTERGLKIDELIAKLQDEIKVFESKLRSVPVVEVLGRKSLPSDTIQETLFGGKQATGELLEKIRGGKFRKPLAFPVRSGQLQLKAQINNRLNKIAELQSQKESIAFVKDLASPVAVLPRGIAEEMLVESRKYIDDDALDGMLRAYDSVNNLFKKSVTSLFPAYHGRNALSNVMQSYLDIGLGVLNPNSARQALLLTTKVPRMVKKISSGKLTKEARDKLIKELDAMEITTKIGTKVKYSTIYDLAQKYNVLGGGQTASDVFAKKGIATAADKPFRAGQNVGTFIENDARMSLFLNNIKRGLPPDQAAERVKEFLFDYGDLTQFEKNVLKRIFPFYTWNRKNIELHFKTLARDPGKIMAEVKLARQFQPTDEKDKLRQQYLPEYLRKGVYIPGKEKGGKLDVIAGFSSPLEAFTTGLTVKNYTDMLAPILKYPIERASGINLYSGKKKGEDDDGTFAKNFPDPLKKFLNFKETKVKTKAGKGWTEYTVDPTKKALAYNAFLGRLTSTLSTALDTDKEALPKLSALLTGVKLYTINLPAQEQKIYKETIREMEDMLDRAGAGYRFEKFIMPKNQ